MNPPEVIFDEKEHRYFLDNQEIPGLSYILKTTGFVDYDGIRKDVMEAARIRGDVLHFAARLYDEDNHELGGLDKWEQTLLEPLDPWVHSRLSGWVKFRQEFEFKPLLIEKPMSHCINGMAYGMTPDRYGTCKMGNAVVEIKATAEIEPSHQIQTAAQAAAFQMEGVKLGRYVVQLLDNDYKLHEFNDRQDSRIFAAALAVTHWRWRNGIK